MRPKDRGATVSLQPDPKKREEVRVMIVDDDPFVRDIIRAKLSTKGLEMIEAANGLEALKKAESENPCLIILDIMMPGIDGFDVCERLRSNPVTVDVPILFLTSKGDLTDRERAMRLGALDFILKPFSPQRLTERVLDIIAYQR